jgi:hypothetical protein
MKLCAVVYFIFSPFDSHELKMRVSVVFLFAGYMMIWDFFVRWDIFSEFMI